MWIGFVLLMFAQYRTSLLRPCRSSRRLYSTNGSRGDLTDPTRPSIISSSSNPVIDTATTSGEALHSNKTDSNLEYNYHRPVLLTECCDYLSIKPGGIYVDCTLGGGGHTREILRRGGSVIGLDQDEEAIKTSSDLLNDYIVNGQLEIGHINFRNLESYLQRSRLAAGNNGVVDGILLDLGVSSHQINEAYRGFAFGADGPLDMRMAQKSIQNVNSITAATIVNEYTADTIADILYQYGDETKSRQIAREIIAARPVLSTGQLAAIINRITPWKYRSQTLARCFQALRIVVNDEMSALDDVLLNAHKCLSPRGRLVVISYHSLEDRKVKRLFKYGTVYQSDESSRSIVERAAVQGAANPWTTLFKGAQSPENRELELNSRARSAKLRVAEILTIPSGDSNDRKTERITSNKTPSSFMGAKQLLKKQRRAEKNSFDDL